MINLSINIDVAAAGWKNAFPKMKRKMEEAAAFAFMRAKKPKAFDGKSFDINILLTTDAAIKRLNRDYRGKDKPTNVLSFPHLSALALAPSRRERGKKRVPPLPLGEGTLPLGDIALALQIIKKECKEQRKTLENHAIHLVVHGVLHLLGYDHMRLKDAKTMESLECDILGALGYPDPYHEPAAKKPERRHG